jgi:DnaJ family protein C protein 3
MGRIHLENRQFSDALTHFHAAVEGDPSNYQTYFKRALVFMALGKYNQALKDFSKVIEIKPDFSAAILQRASLLLKQGQLDLSHIDFENVLRKEPHNSEALSGYEMVEVSRKDLDEAKYYVDIDDCNTAVELLTRLIETCPWDSSLRKMRSDCYLSLGDASRAVSDLRFATKLVMDDTDGLYRLSSIQYQLGEIEDSLREIRECLKLDPEHKFCFPLYKKLKKN